MILKELIPSKEKVTLTSTSTKGGGKKKNQQQHSYKKDNVLCVKTDPEYKSKIVIQSLETLISIFRANGPLLKPSIHKDVQTVVLSLCLSIQANDVTKFTPPYVNPSVRRSLYRLLSTLTTDSHSKFPTPLRYAAVVFSKGVQYDPDVSVREVCREGVALSETFIHPRAPALAVDTPLSEDRMKAIFNDVMTIHNDVIVPSKEPVVTSSSTVNSSSEISETINDAIKNINDKKVIMEKSNDDYEDESMDVSTTQILLSRKGDDSGSR